MKNFGCISEYHNERTADLLNAYFKCLNSCSKVCMLDIFQKVVDMPATQFWVSVPRAAVVVASIMRGDKLKYMRHNKREMFFEIHRRVVRLQRDNIDMPLRKLVEIVVPQPAPKFYLAPGSARALILKARKRHFEIIRALHS